MVDLLYLCDSRNLFATECYTEIIYISINITFEIVLQIILKMYMVLDIVFDIYLLNITKTMILRGQIDKFSVIKLLNLINKIIFQATRR